MKTRILSTIFAGALIAVVPVMADDTPNAAKANGYTVEPVPASTNGRSASHPTAGPAAAPVAATPAAAGPTTNDSAPAVLNGTPQPGDQPSPAPAIATNVNVSSIITLPNGQKGLVMNFRGVPLEQVLNFMSEAAGLAINPDNRVDVSGKVNLWSVKPVSKEDAIKMLIQMLQDNGYAAIQNDRMLTILRADEASKKDILVQTGSDPAGIPKTPTMVTQIIPVHSLNVMQLIKSLQPLLGPNAIMNADDSANAIVLTDTQANVHHIVEIIAALDGVTSGNASIEVFPLKYGDSKSVAQMIKDLFPSPDQNQNGNGTRSSFGRYRGMGSMMSAMMGGGPPGAGSDNGGGGENGHTPTAKVSAVNDDHSNAVIVSAPDALMPTIEHLIKELDKAVEDATMAKIFQLHNADPVEMANTITALFPDDSSQNDASRTSFGFRGFGLSPFGGQQRSSGNDPSDRMKKMAKVIAVADARTQSVLVTAGTNVMDQIELIVKTLDESKARKMKPFYISLQNADPADVLPILQNLFPPMTGTTSSSSSAYGQQNPLTQRANTMLQNQNSQSSSSSGFGNSGGRGAGF